MSKYGFDRPDRRVEEEHRAIGEIEELARHIVETARSLDSIKRLALQDALGTEFLESGEMLDLLTGTSKSLEVALVKLSDTFDIINTFEGNEGS